jgi:hypothetical protein
MDVDEGQHRVAEPALDRADADAVAFEPGPPPAEAAGGHFEGDFDGEAVAHPRRRHVRPRKERQVRPRVSFGVCVEEMVGAGIVLVDAPFDEAHPQDAGVEVEVFLSGTGYRRNVMEAVDRMHITTIAGFLRALRTRPSRRSGSSAGCRSCP